jgi:hypothetical protein
VQTALENVNLVRRQVESLPPDRSSARAECARSAGGYFGEHEITGIAACWIREARPCIAAAAPGSLTFGTPQLVQKPFRHDQIGGVETLRKAVVDRLEAGDGVGESALIAQ